MKCRQIIKQYGHLRVEEIPPEIQAHIQCDPEAQAWFNQAETQRNMLQLKQYEQPAPEVHGRVVFHVRTRIEAGERLDVPELAAPRNAFVLPVTVAAALLVAGTVVFLKLPGGAPTTPEVAVGEKREAAQPNIEDLFKPIPTANTQTNHLAGNTNSFPRLAPSKPGRVDTQRVIGPPSGK